MTDIEEPAAKVSKLDEEHLEDGDYLEGGDDLEDGQEEWLSEEILTDEDYNTATEQDQSEFHANTSKDDSMEENQQDAEQQKMSSKQNIEETLNNFENSRSNDQTDMPEELSAFLVKNTDGSSAHKAQEANQEESDLDQSTKQSDDDGNDTDDLLRMLGEDNSKKKETPASKPSQMKATHHSSDEDDDDYIFEGAKVTKLKISKDALLNTETQVKRLRVAKGAFIQKTTASKAKPEEMSDKEVGENEMPKNVMKSKTVKIVSKRPACKAVSEDFSDLDDDSIPTTNVINSKTVKIITKKPASKAVSEDFSDFDEDSIQSSDEALTMKRIFGVRKTVSVANRGPQLPRRSAGGINAVKTTTKRVVSIEPKIVVKQLEAKPPLKPPMKAPSVRRVLRSADRDTGKDIQDEAHLDEVESKTAPKRSTPRVVFRAAPPTVKTESDHHLEDEQHSEENSMELYSDEEKAGQRLMKPERMDEEIPSDADSNSDVDSYYDELPSSDSEDAEDWFTLDLRAERAADYLPLLGTNARSLLTAEQERASARLESLRQSARALCAGRRALASQLRLARQALATLDAALSAH